MMPLMIYEFKIVLSVWVSKKLKNRHATRFSVVFWWLKWSSEPQFAIFPGASRNPVHVGSAHPKAGTAIPYWRVKLVNLGAPAIFSGSFHFKSPLVIKHGLGSSMSLNGVSVSWENPSNFCQLARFHTRRAVPRPARFLILTALAQKQKWNKLWRAQEKPSMIWGGSVFGLFEAGWNDGEPTLQTSWKSFKVAQGCFLTWLAGWYPRASTDHPETISPVSSGAIIYTCVLRIPCIPGNGGKWHDATMLQELI